MLNVCICSAERLNIFKILTQAHIVKHTVKGKSNVIEKRMVKKVAEDLICIFWMAN